MTTIPILKIILNIFEAGSFITGMLCFKKMSNSIWKWFPVYLGFVLVAELTGKYFTAKGLTAYKMAMYDYIVIPAEFLFFIWQYYREFKTQHRQHISIIAAVLYIAALFADIFIVSQKKFLLLSFSYTVGTFVLLIQAMYYILKLSASDDVLYFKSNMMFWVSMGLLIFYVGSIPFFGMMNTIYAAQNKELFYGLAYSMYGVNVIMYFLFILGFVWAKPKL